MSNNKFVILLICVFSVATDMDTETLECVHIISRHGEKNPDLSFTYPGDPNINMSFYPFLEGQLNLMGRRTAYDLGTTLRKRYHEFLGDVYSMEAVEAWSSYYVRNIFSLELIMAGLFPPSPLESWNENLNWQPTVQHITPQKDDKLFLVLHQKDYLNLYWKTCRTDPSMLSILQTYQPWLKYMENHTALDCSCTRHIFMMYSIFQTQEDSNLTLPDWSKPVYPDIMRALTLIEYQFQIYTRDLRRMIIGGFMSKLLNDSENRIFKGSDKKFFLYSAHETNIAQILIVMGFMYPHVPYYAAYLALEIHKIEDQHIFKVFYRDSKYSELQLLRNEEGEDHITYEKFKIIVDNIVGEDYDGNVKDSSLKSMRSYFWITFLVLHLLFIL